MSDEILVLFLTMGLGFIHFMAPAFLRLLEIGPMAILGPRDNLPPCENKTTLRLQRASSNFLETLPFAIALLLLPQILGVSNAMTIGGAWAYLIGRTLFLPFYAIGIPGLRSLAFGVSLAGLITMGMGIVQQLP